jgi:hypothetical protein
MKITRGHFNRKILSFGLMAFLGVSLISTGFASWIMSSGAEAEMNGNVSIGTIEESNLTFGEIKFTNDNKTISFDAAKDDNSGDIKWNETSSESLAIEFTTTIAPATYLDDLSIVIAVPQSVMNAHNAGYIELPTCAFVEGETDAEEGEEQTSEEVLAKGVQVNLIEDGKAVTLDAKNGITSTITYDDKTDTFTIVCKITFKWGKVFGGENPSIYLDDATKNGDLSYEAKRTLLYSFRRMIYDLPVPPATEEEKVEGVTYYTDAEVASYYGVLPFDITLIATAN